VVRLTACAALCGVSYVMYRKLTRVNLRIVLRNAALCCDMLRLCLRGAFDVLRSACAALRYAL
jgi:hypothetical protein